jgi:tripartite-type tricarboxylate transporter receptor subunit TctC
MLNYATPGMGTPQHTGTELLQARTYIKLQHVPYKSMTNILSDLSTGQVDVALSDFGSARTFVDGSRLRLLAVATEERLAAAPTVPTFDELGVKALPISFWHSLVVPAATPDQIVEQLRASLKRALQSSKVKAQMDAASSQPFFLAGEEGDAYVRTQAAMWEPIVKSLNVTLD